MARRCMGCMKEYDEEYTVCPYCGYEDGTQAKEAYHIVPGTVLHSRYIVGKTIGYGGFGVTYIGWDFVLEQVVAIKEYLPSEYATRVPGEETISIYTGEKAQQFEAGKNKFADEARRLAKFNSVEGVVEIKDTFSENNTAYIVMEYLEGETLKEKIKKDNTVQVDETIEIIKSVLITLSKVHKDGIIHRDIAPDNIFICKDGTVKLLDFGASRYATILHSKSLSVILKEGYSPEEQYRSKGIQGPWSDIYAVAATMYKMLTGETPEDAMERAENDKLKPVSKYGIKLSKSRENALMNALNVFAQDRTQSAEVFLDELDADNVEKKKRTMKKIDLGKWPLWSKVLICVITVVLIATGVVLSQKSTFALEEGKSYVPEVINLKDEKAEKKIENNELTTKIVGQEKSEKVDEARVMTQYPDAGRIVNTGEQVEIKISAGNSVSMIDLMGKAKEDAQELLGVMGFTKIVFKEKRSSAVIGTVIKQSTLFGKEVDVNKKIILTVSKGLGEIDTSRDVKVPKFIGMQYKRALNRAANRNLYLVKGSARVSNEPAGTILSQDKKQGSRVKQGITIRVVVSMGNEKVKVPYVTYLTEGEAKKTLSGYNLRYKTSYRYSDNVSKGLVISQSINSGKDVKPGEQIGLVVSKGRVKTSVPNVKGMNMYNAFNRIVDSELRYEVIAVHSESVDWGKIISYAPSGDHEKGTKITLTVSSGTAGKLVTEGEYNNKYADESKYNAEKRYRYSTRLKEFATFGTASKSGWTREGGKTIISGPKTSLWLQANKDAQAGTFDKGSYAVEIIKEKSTCYTCYAYFCDCKRLSAATANYAASQELVAERHKPNKCDGIARNYLFVTSREPLTSFPKSSIGGYSAPKTLSYYNPSSFGYIYQVNYRGSNITFSGFTSNQRTGYCHLWPKSGPYYVYRTLTTEYQYKFWRWAGWSEWGEWTSKKNTSDIYKEDSQIMYYVIGRTP